MRTSLKATTALLASLNLALPLPALAQTEQAQGQNGGSEAAGPDCEANPGDPACVAGGSDAAEGAEGSDGTPAPQESGTPGQAGAEEAGEGEAPGASGVGEGDGQAPREAPDAGPSEAAGGAGATGEAQATGSAPGGSGEAGAEASPAGDPEASLGGDAGVPDASEAENVVGAEEPDDAGAGTEPEAGAETSAESLSASEPVELEAPEAGDAIEEATNPAIESEADATIEDETGGGEPEDGTDPLAEALREDAEAQSPAERGETAPQARQSQPDASGPADTAIPEPADETGSASATVETAVPGDGTDPAGSAGETGITAPERDAQAPIGSEAEAQEDQSLAEPAQDTGQDGQAAADAASGPDASGPAEDGQTAVTGAETPQAAAAAEDAQPVETESETVTQETARSSSEDFQSDIDRTEDPGAQTEVAESDDDEGGLSTLEKSLLLGAGALAVGAVLNNNRRVVASSDDRVVVSRGEGQYELIKDDNAILARPGSQVETQTFDDGSSRTTVTYDDGSQVVTIRDANLRVLRRERITPQGERIVLVNDLNQTVQPVDMQRLQASAQPSRSVDLSDEQALREALSYNPDVDRSYSLNQVRSVREVREQVPAVDLEAITFDTGSAAIRPEQAEELRDLGTYIRETIAQNPRAVFLVEGHTDAVGDAAYNLALSDRRAESVALALAEYFDVPTSNLVVQGYGERFLKVETQDAERANRRATIRNITPLLQTAAAGN